MKPVRLILISLTLAYSSYGQTIPLQQKFFYTCKIWGFLKYYDNYVATCHTNWDSVLLHTLPLVKSAPDVSQFNDALDTMLAAAGPVTFPATHFPDTLPSELKRNKNFGWMSDPWLRADVQAYLLTTAHNFWPFSGCYVIFDTVNDGGLLSFPQDNPMLNADTYVSFPDEYHRLLVFFKFWNIISCFNPYNYVLDKPVDTLLMDNVLNFDTVSNSHDLFYAVKRFTAGLDDAHVHDFTRSSHYENNLSNPALTLHYIENKYVVVKSGVSSIPVGDIIISVNGKTPVEWEDSLSVYESYGNMSVYRRFMYEYLLLWAPGATPVHIVYSDTLGTTDSATLYPDPSWGAGTFDYYYPADSLTGIAWTTMQCNVGYLNVGNLSAALTDTAYAHLKNAPAIIVDMRNYPRDASVQELAKLMFPATVPFANFTVPDITYPGTFFWVGDSIGSNNPDPYRGTVIILFNEMTQSAAEFNCMTLKASSRVIKVGSQTAGADGGITYIQLTKDISSGFTSEGVFYPNGDSTQRIGIVPDIVVKPTINGIMQGRDELVDKALEIACSLVAGTNKLIQPRSISVFPNPAHDYIDIALPGANSETFTIAIQSITGQTMFETNVPANPQQPTRLDISWLPPGMYFVKVSGPQCETVYKLTKMQLSSQLFHSGCVLHKDSCCHLQHQNGRDTFKRRVEVFVTNILANPLHA